MRSPSRHRLQCRNPPRTGVSPMRIVVSEFISLDGVVQAPGGPEEDTDGGVAHGGWSHPYFDPEVMGARVFEDLQRTDALLFGRRTWRGMADAWPGRAGDPFADKMNELPKHVASQTLSDADMEWNTSLLPADRTMRRSASSAGRRAATSWSGAARRSSAT